MTERTLREKIIEQREDGTLMTPDQRLAWDGAFNRVLAVLDAHTAAQPAPDAPKCWHPRTRHSMREGTVTCEVCGASISTFEPVPPPVVSHETPVHVTQTGLSDTDAPPQPAPDAVAEAPTDGQLVSACLSYNHGYGLMDPEQRNKLHFQCREWWRSIARAINDGDRP